MKLTTSEDLPEQLIDFSTIEKRVFTENKGIIYIGAEEIKPELKEILQEQARYIKSSQLWEIFQSTIQNEAANLALIQSKDYDEVKTAKMLHHWKHVFENILHILTKE